VKLAYHVWVNLTEAATMYYRYESNEEEWPFNSYIEPFRDNQLMGESLLDESDLFLVVF